MTLPQNTKRFWIGGAAAALAAIPALWAIATTQETILPTMKILAPLAYLAFVFGLVANWANHRTRTRALRELPEIQFPFFWLTLQEIFYGYYLLLFTALYFWFTKAQETSLINLLFSPLTLIIFIVNTALVAGGGGQLLKHKEKHFILYKDAPSPSRFSRQDFLFPVFGQWKDGLILGWDLFLYSTIHSWEIPKKSLIFHGEREGAYYDVMIFNPKTRRFLENVLQEQAIEYSESGGTRREVSAEEKPVEDATTQEKPAQESPVEK